MVCEAIKKLVQYGLDTGLIRERDAVYARNQILEVMGMDEYEEPGDISGEICLEEVLKELLDYAYETTGALKENSVVFRDLFDTKLMNCLMPRPSEVADKFWKIYHEESPEAATDYYYKLSQDSDYIRRYRIKKDLKWMTSTEYGDLDITVNLSKPEKDPKAIAAAKLMKQSGYPKCQLCMENEGYAGRANHPARNNHRIIPITIDNNQWGFQYSPYVYYNEHCIVFNGQHVPMKIERATFVNSSTQSACFSSISFPRMSLPSTMYSARRFSSSFRRDGSTARPITSIRPMFSFLMWCSSWWGWYTPRGNSSVVMLFLSTRSSSYISPFFLAMGVMVLWGSPSVSAKMKAASSV